MNKVLLYLTLAIILGLTVTLVPLMTFATVKTPTFLFGSNAIQDKVRGLEGSAGTSDATIAPASDLQILAAGFVVAMIAYLLARHRMPGRNEWTRTLPY